MERFLYLALDLGALIVPLVFSFHPRIRFHRQWRAFWPACIIVAVLFIAWDVAFTRMGVWGFNEAYLIGIELIGLPMEEWLFFLCIPYACVFTFFVFGVLRPDPWSPRASKVIARTLIIACVVMGLYNMDRWYTATTFLALAAALAFLLAAMRAAFLGRFFVSYLVVLLPFFLIDGILTGSFIEGEVVWYDDAGILGIRLGTIPVEDVFYGMLLVLLNVVFFERWRKAGQ